MPKCTKCGKKFQTLSALNDHYRAVHPNEKFVAPKTSSSRNLLVGLVIVIIVFGALVGVLIYYSSTSTTTDNSGANSPLGKPINSTLYDQLTGVSTSTLAAVGTGSAITQGLQKPTGSPLTLNGKPEFLYIGADYCPYCAIERWAMAVALSKFGTLSGMSYMISAPDDLNITTLSFSNVTYSSNYIAFQAYETQDRARNNFQTPSQAAQSVFSQYDSGGSIPFIDIDNQYVFVGAQYALPSTGGAGIFNKLNWTQIGSQLNNPSTDMAKAVDGSANYLISMICKVDGNQPSTICGQSFSSINVALVPPISQVQTGGPLSVGIPTVLKTSRLLS